MSWSYVILSACIYIIGIYFLLKHKEKRQGFPAPPSPTPDVIAIPRNYIINVIENTHDIDYRKYADVSLNITDILKNNSLRTDGDSDSNHKEEVRISYANTDFSEFITIKTSKA